MEEKILTAIAKENGKITFKNLTRLININNQELDELLLKMKLDGKIIQNGNKYALFPKDQYLGEIVESVSGKKYVLHDGEKIAIASDFFDGVILSDVVSFRLNEENEAEITTIVNRVFGKMTCEVRDVAGEKKLIPYREGIYFNFDKRILDQFFDGDIIVMNIDPTKSIDEINATFVKKIGRRDDPFIDDEIIALNYGFDNDYDDEYLAEVMELPTHVTEEEMQDRVDYINQKCFTIDGKNTKDMDDAVYGEMMEDGTIRVYVHIADVSHYIKPGSRIFKRACEKTTSAYLKNSVYHMLHYIISNGICSLNPNAVRLTKTVVMDIDKNGNIVNFDLVRSAICSRKKMAYEDVDEILMNNNMVSGYEYFKKELYVLYDAMLRLDKRYTDRGCKINFASTELDVDYNPDGSIRKINGPMNSLTRKIIEYLMVAANETVANWFLNMDLWTVFRVHEFPDAKKVNQLIERLNKSGYNIKPITDIENPKAMQEIIEKLSTYDEFAVISQMIIQVMQLARYTTENLGHYGLGLLAYLHFTSPIRRLADLLVHTMIDMVFDHSDQLTPEYLNQMQEIVEDLCKHASKMERQADAASRDALKSGIIKALALHKDVTYEASVIGIGKKIKLRIDGIETNVDSHYLANILGYDSKRKRYYDKDTGQHLKIGTKLEVKVLDADAINNHLRVKVLGMINQKAKKKVLEP